MNFASLKSKLALAVALSTIATLGASEMAVAQPDTAPTKPKRAGRRAKGGLPAKTKTAIETALGKPLTAEQKTQLDAAANDRRAELAAAQTKFNNEVARITGLPLDKVPGAKKRTPKPKMPKA